MSKDTKELFTRPASGLIREVSTAKATFFCFLVIGNNLVLNAAYVVFYPQTLIAGVPLFVWGMTLVLIPTLCYVLAVAILSHAMPRTGGDYIFTSRILHPFLGWLEGWMLIWFMGATSGYNGWATNYNIGAWFKVGSLIYPGWFSIGALLHETNSLLILGLFCFLALGAMTLASPRKFHLIFSALIVMCLAAAVLQLITIIGVSTEAFSANFIKFTQTTPQEVMALAKEKGWDPTWFDWMGFIALLGFGIFGYTGSSFSSYLAGELKGNIQRNVIISTVAGTVLCWLSYVYIVPFVNVVGYEFLNAWAFLFWNAPNLAPMQTAPMFAVLSLMARPETGALSLVAGFFVMVVWNFLAVTGIMYGSIRVVFAQTMDRFWPKKLAEINERTHQPLYATAFLLVIGYIFYAAQILGYTPAAGLWYLGATSVIGFFLFPPINVILLKWRRPDIYPLTPGWSRSSFLGLPIMAWLGIVYLAYLVPVFSIINLWQPINSMFQLQSTALLDYMFGTGLTLIAVLTIIGALYYFARRYYLAKQGIEVDLIFRAIPPE